MKIPMVLSTGALAIVLSVLPAAAEGVQILGTSPEAIHLAEDRAEFSGVLAAIIERGRTGTPNLWHIPADQPRRVEAREGKCEGRILEAPRGSGGFGYDPVFLSDELGQTFAEADAETKNRVSHRGRALRAMAEVLREAAARIGGKSSPVPMPATRRRSFHERRARGYRVNPDDNPRLCGTAGARFARLCPSYSARTVP